MKTTEPFNGANRIISQPSHLYTIWRYDHNPDTIIDHKDVLREKGKVRWLVLCGNDDKKYFEESIPQKEVEKINRQAKKQETILYIQCLELFREQIFAGLIDEISWGIKVPIEKDEFLPEYYKTLLNNKKLRLNTLCSILLEKLEPIDMEEIFNLFSKRVEILPKYSYNITRIVSQKHIRNIFDKKLTKIRELKDVQRERERCRAIAALLWKDKPDTTIASMTKNEDIINIGCEGFKYTEKILRDWIKDLCPDRRPGRRPNK